MTIKEFYESAKVQGKEEYEMVTIEMGKDRKYRWLKVKPRYNQCIDIGYGTWTSDDIDYRQLYCGNCFRTDAEAEREKYNIYEKLTGKKWVVAE